MSVQFPSTQCFETKRAGCERCMDKPSVITTVKVQSAKLNKLSDVLHWLPDDIIVIADCSLFCIIWWLLLKECAGSEDCLEMKAGLKRMKSHSHSDSSRQTHGQVSATFAREEWVGESQAVSIPWLCPTWPILIGCTTVPSFPLRWKAWKGTLGTMKVRQPSSHDSVTWPSTFCTSAIMAVQTGPPQCCASRCFDPHTFFYWMFLAWL